MRSTITVGTRGSTLAMAQAKIAISRLRNADPSLDFRLQTITTAGDRDQRASLSEIGGKGIFVKELEVALLSGRIDLAVHSFKDLTSFVPDGLDLCGFFPPESVRDALVSRDRLKLADLPPAARVGTGSMRRKALLSRLRPDLEFVDIRGNIDTRLSKMDEGLYDAIVLSEAGLIRLGLVNRITEALDPEVFYPAPGQGVIALEVRKNDDQARKLCLQAGDAHQVIISTAEFSVLSGIGFDCRTPFGVYTRLSGKTISLRGFYVDPGTGQFIEKQAEGSVLDPHEAGRILCDLFLRRG